MLQESNSTPQTESKRTARSQPPRLIVGVGASAGGLDAFSQLLKALPAETGMAFVFVQHLPPSHKSMMVPLLTKHTSMPVREAEDGLTVEADHVYMIPPGRILLIHEGRLCLSKPRISSARQFVIDDFLISLADDALDRSAGLILSGTGSDGSVGIKAIKEAGGVVLVEDPEGASYKGMPKSAAATGLADYILPISELANKLVVFARQPHLLRRSRNQPPHGLADTDLLRIIEALRLRTGYDFKEYKKPTLSRRIQRRMALRNLSDPGQYLDTLNNDDHEPPLLIKDMLIGVTSFFRDSEAFTELAKRVARPLARRHSGKTPLRVWIPGCTTGEEAYSVAILLNEEFARQKINLDVQIFATDIDEDAVHRARAGRYSANAVSEMPEEYLPKYFEEEDGSFVVKKAIRESITFAVQNLIGDPPFSKLDLICCRNVLIYLEASVQNKLLPLFHFALNDNGYLFLGSSESAIRHETMFRPVSKQHRIYQKTPATIANGRQLSKDRIYPFNRNSTLPSAQASKGSPVSSLNSALFSAEGMTRDALLAHYAPAAVLVNSNYEALYFHGATSRYLNQPEGEPTNDLYAITAKGLKTRIWAAVQKAKKTGDRACVRATTVEPDNSPPLSVVIAAYPVQRHRSSEILFLVTFSECMEETQRRQASDQGIEKKETELSSQLEYELYAIKQDLQSTIEQLETSNEELKASNEEIISMNEELQSSNEELETSREELQSLNEELSTVNNQLEEKVLELESSNNDLSNLLSSTDFATLFLDVNLRIRRFTPATHKVIHLLESDIGRPLADLAFNFRDTQLIQDARCVLQTRQPIEKQIADELGNHYLRRITLYRTTHNRIEGVVVTFTDVTDITVAMEQLQSREKQQALVAKFGQEALAEPDLEVLFNKAAQWITEAVTVELCSILKMRGDALYLEAGAGWTPDSLGPTSVSSMIRSQGAYTLSSKTPVIVEDLTAESRFQDTTLLKENGVKSALSVIIGPLNAPWGVLAIHTRNQRLFTREDVDFLQTIAHGLWATIQRSLTLNEIKSQAVQLQLALRLGQMGSWCWDLESQTLTWDEALFDMLGVPFADTVSPALFFDRVHPDDLPVLEASLAELQNTESPSAWEYRIVHGRSKEVRWLTGYGGIHRQGPSQRKLMYGVNYDVTERKHYEVTLRDREEWLRLALTSAELTSSWIDLGANEISHYSPTGNKASEEAPAGPVPLRRYLDQIHQDDRDMVETTWRRTIDGQNSFIIEYRLKGEAGFHWLRNWGQYVDVQGNPRLAGVTMDITREKENEARLQAAKQVADASNQAKSAFLANMSHEIRTPLTAILGYTDLLHMELNSEGQSETYLNKIKTNGQNLLEIINDVLDLSKVEADKIEINKQHFAIKDLLAEVVSLMHLRAKEKDLGFTIDVQGEVPTLVCTDMGRLKQVLTNLISNAIKFTNQGSIRLELSASSRPDKQDTRLIFRIIDTGIGIEHKLLDKIFEPFEQADASVAKNYGGTGLGLTISKRISKLLGGTLTADSSPGQGSTFTLQLPIGATAKVEYIAIDGVDTLVHQYAVPWVDAQQLEDVHVLVVDDIDDVLTLIQQMLKKAGAAVTTASNGLQAIETIERCETQGKPVDIVLMDTMMPVIDGFTAVGRLRENGFAKPIVALTAAAMTNDRARCLQAGCDDYLSKPVSFEKLLSVLHTHLSPKTGTAPVNQGAKVLIIEDNVDAGEAIKTLLTMSGYECRHMINGESGIIEAQRFQPELIILDLTLPDVDGYKVAERLQKLESTANARLIALSGQDLERQKTELKDAGFDAYLQKPVGRSALATYFPALRE